MSAAVGWELSEQCSVIAFCHIDYGRYEQAGDKSCYRTLLLAFSKLEALLMIGMITAPIGLDYSLCPRIYSNEPFIRSFLVIGCVKVKDSFRLPKSVPWSNVFLQFVIQAFVNCKFRSTYWTPVIKGLKLKRYLPYRNFIASQIYYYWRAS